MNSGKVSTGKTAQELGVTKCQNILAQIVADGHAHAQSDLPNGRSLYFFMGHMSTNGSVDDFHTVTMTQLIDGYRAWASKNPYPHETHMTDDRLIRHFGRIGLAFGGQAELHYSGATKRLVAITSPLQLRPEPVSDEKLTARLTMLKDNWLARPNQGPTGAETILAVIERATRPYGAPQEPLNLSGNPSPRSATARPHTAFAAAPLARPNGGRDYERE